jgi:predicted amidohydrolase YtcJ
MGRRFPLLTLASLSAILALGSAVACQGAPSPQPDATPSLPSPSFEQQTLDALRARPPEVIDARTRPEPHPVIPIGSTLTAYIGPRFLTGEDFVPEARVVVADEGGRVRALLREVPQPNPYKTVTLPGALAVAGLHDAHLHLEGLGEAGETFDASVPTSPKALGLAVAAFAKKNPSLAIIQGRGWDQSRYPGQVFPTAKDLDGSTTLPVILRRVDGHAALVNRVLLEKAGITTDTPDPPGGRIMRNAKGVPTGVLVDNAIDLVSPALPKPSAADHERWLKAGLQAAADAGLVAVHDMGMSVDAFTVLRAMDKKAPLPVRVFVYLDGSDDAAYDVLGTVVASDTLALMGVKLYADGALGSRGAALLEDYSDEPGQRGLLLTEPPVLDARIKKAHERRSQVAVHAIGDRANRLVIDALIANRREDIRDRLEHAQVLNVDDIPRLYAPRITVSMQPTHATSDMRWAEARLGKARLAGAYAWRSIWTSGAALAFGSDAPVESVRPTWGIYAGITGKDHDGTPAGGFLPEQTLSQAQVLRAFSRHAAWAVNLERHAGALTPGMFFDVSVFDIDAAAATDAGDASAWLRAKPVATGVGGVIRPIAAGG